MTRIILADDDELIREIVSETLRSQGYIVGAVSNGSDALKAIWIKRPHLVILDCNMPEISGINVLRQLRKTPEFNDLLVLMLTGRRSQADEEIARYEGANAYLRKPFQPDELLFHVERLLVMNTAPERFAHRG